MFLPKWKGFVVNAEYEEMAVTEAIEKTQAISRCLTNVSIFIGYNLNKRTLDGLEFNKVRLKMYVLLCDVNVTLFIGSPVSSSVKINM
jgi:hypothetical protein